MLRTLVLSSIICCATLSGAFKLLPAQTQESPDIPTLLREVRKKSDENWRKMRAEYPNYTYKWRTVWRKAGKHGKIEEESTLYEWFLPAKCRIKKCYAVSILLAKNGKPLAAEKIEKQRAKAGEKLERAEGDARATTEPWTQDYRPMWMQTAYSVGRPFSKEWKALVLLDGQEVLEKGEFYASSRETINGRAAIALSFRPRADAVFSEGTRYMPQTEGKLWIDEADKVLIRLAIWRKGTEFSETTSDYLLAHAALAFDMTRTKEGLWFSCLARINGLSYPNLFTEVEIDWMMEQSDLQRFKTDVKSLEINDPIKITQ